MNYPKWNGNRMAYARLLLPEALPDVDYVIYCDVDFLWLRDVAELWKCRDSQYVLQSVKDMDDTVQKEECWFRKNGLPFNSEKYVCCGLSIRRRTIVTVTERFPLCELASA